MTDGSKPLTGIEKPLMVWRIVGHCDVTYFLVMQNGGMNDIVEGCTKCMKNTLSLPCSPKATSWWSCSAFCLIVMLDKQHASSPVPVRIPKFVSAPNYPSACSGVPGPGYQISQPAEGLRLQAFSGLPWASSVLVCPLITLEHFTMFPLGFFIVVRRMTIPGERPPCTTMLR